MIRTLLFDATGTLIELAEPVGETYSRIASIHGVALPAWRLDDAFARVRRRMPPMVFPDAPADEIAAREREWWRDLVRRVFLATDGTARFADFEAYFDALFAHFARGDAWRLREGAAPTLAELARRGLRLGVASNFDLRLAQILEAVGITGFFEVVMTPGIARAAKPDRGLLQAALAALGESAATAACVGNDPAIDGEAARACGMRFIDVSAPGALAALPSLVAGA